MSQRFPLQALAVGFLAGALAVPLFQQGMILILHLAGQISTFPWSSRHVPPFAVPALANQMFWGGLGGMVFGAVVEAISGRLLWLKGVIFGLLGPWLLGNGLSVPMIKGGPLLFGLAMPHDRRSLDRRRFRIGARADLRAPETEACWPRARKVRWLAMMRRSALCSAVAVERPERWPVGSACAGAINETPLKLTRAIGWAS